MDLPQGGLVNPMAVSYDPTDMYRLFRSTPKGGYTDSEAVDPNASIGPPPPLHKHLHQPGRGGIWHLELQELCY